MASSLPGTTPVVETAPHVKQEEEAEMHCPKCDYSTSQKDHFQFHILTHILSSTSSSASSGESANSRDAPSLSTPSIVGVEDIPPSTSNQREQFNSSVQSPTKFTCPVCLFSTANEHVFSIHLLTHKTQGEQSLDTDSIQSSAHVNDANESPNTVRGNGSKKLYCPICRFCSIHKSNFDRHLASHVRNGRICCDKCHFSTESIQEIKMHVASHYSRNTLRISCPHCDFTTANKSYFKVHLATHTGEGKMHCNYCSYSTVYKSNFRQHVAAHENKTELQCPLCDFKCVCKSEYGLHFATHTGEKRLACPYCKFNTSNKSYFKQHVGSHTGAGKLACPFCKFSTVNKSYYRIHVSKHTGEGTLKCSLCPFTTVYKNNFRRHIAKHQTVEEESLRVVAALSQKHQSANKADHYDRMMAYTDQENNDGNNAKNEKFYSRAYPDRDASDRMSSAMCKGDLDAQHEVEPHDRTQQEEECHVSLEEKEYLASQKTVTYHSTGREEDSLVSLHDGSSHSSLGSHWVSNSAPQPSEVVVSQSDSLTISLVRPSVPTTDMTRQPALSGYDHWTQPYRDGDLQTMPPPAGPAAPLVRTQPESSSFEGSTISSSSMKTWSQSLES